MSQKGAIVKRCAPSTTPPDRVAKIVEHLATIYTYRVKDGLPGATGASNVSLPTFEELVAACRDEKGPAAGPENGEDDDEQE